MVKWIKKPLHFWINVCLNLNKDKPSIEKLSSRRITVYSLFPPLNFFAKWIPGLRHFLLRNLTCKGVGCVFWNIRSLLQQLNSMTSLWSLRTAPQLHVAPRRLHAHCLVWTYHKKSLIFKFKQRCDDCNFCLQLLVQCYSLLYNIINPNRVGLHM